MQNIHTDTFRSRLKYTIMRKKTNLTIVERAVIALKGFEEVAKKPGQQVEPAFQSAHSPVYYKLAFPIGIFSQTLTVSFFYRKFK